MFLACGSSISAIAVFEPDPRANEDVRADLNTFSQVLPNICCLRAVSQPDTKEDLCVLSGWVHYYFSLQRKGAAAGSWAEVLVCLGTWGLGRLDVENIGTSQ